MKTPKVYNIRGPHPNDAVLCDRRTPFGNPFIIGKDGDRDEVCDKFDTWVFMPEQRWLRAKILKELRGQDLLCHCKPLRCHCDTIIRIANAS